MKPFASILLAVACAGAYPAYDKKEFLEYKAKSVFSDRADQVLNANTPESALIETFHHEIFGEIKLLAGNEKESGFRHILARHTANYFINYSDKNQNTLFEPKVSGSDLIYSMKEFYKHCVDIGIYNRKTDRNIAYIGFVELDGKPAKCLLVVRKETKEIITFYPFNEKREGELLKELEERERFHLD